jgi:hypothetical protein
MGTQTVPRRSNRCNSLSLTVLPFFPGLKRAIRLVRRWEEIVERRAEELGRADPSWHGPGTCGLQHFIAARNPKAVPGMRLYR